MFPKLTLYLEVAGITLFIVCALYIIPLGIILGELQSATVALTGFNGWFMWKYNRTFHDLLNKWRGGK